MKRKKESGQSTLEYVLVMAVVVGAVITLLGLLKKNQYFFKNVASPLVSYLRYNYKYADPAAQGWDEGNPQKHIQISTPNDAATFRLFRGKSKQ
jgi:hypothetical protein